MGKELVHSAQFLLAVYLLVSKILSIARKLKGKLVLFYYKPSAFHSFQERQI